MTTLDQRRRPPRKLVHTMFSQSVPSSLPSSPLATVVVDSIVDVEFASYLSLATVGVSIELLNLTAELPNEPDMVVAVTSCKIDAALDRRGKGAMVLEHLQLESRLRFNRC